MTWALFFVIWTNGYAREPEPFPAYGGLYPSEVECRRVGSEVTRSLPRKPSNGVQFMCIKAGKP